MVENSAIVVQKKRKLPKVFLIVIILIIGGVVAFFLSLSLFNRVYSSKYEEILSTYYEAISENNTNVIESLISSNFKDALSSLKIEGNGYEIYSYNLEKVDTVESSSLQKMTYMLLLKGNGSEFSYLCEAYFSEENGEVKLQYIKKIYKGKKITGLFHRRSYKGVSLLSLSGKNCLMYSLYSPSFS